MTTNLTHNDISTMLPPLRKEKDGESSLISLEKKNIFKITDDIFILFFIQRALLKIFPFSNNPTLLLFRC